MRPLPGHNGTSNPGGVPGVKTHMKPYSLVLAAFLPGVLAAQETASLTQRSVVIYNVAGHITLRHGSGDAVTIRATAQGPDGSQLRFENDTEGSRGRFRVVYPDVDRIASPDDRGYGTDGLDLRRDGTFGGDDGDGWRRGNRRDRVRVGGSSGFRGYADLEVSIPAGRNVTVHLVAGRLEADGVEGDVMVDTWGADAVATNVTGNWDFDAGSGGVEVRGIRGSLKIDAGSGGANLADVTGDMLDIDAGSGGTTVTNVSVGRFNLDVGSGGLTMRGITARRGSVDAGSGRVTLAYAPNAVIEDLSIESGSGGVDLTTPTSLDARVTIERGSGGLNIQREGAMLERRDSDTTVLRFGEGRGRVAIETGSGGVTIR